MTATEIIAQPSRLAATPMPSFVDMDRGAWQGKSYREVRQADPEGFASWFDTPHLAVLLGGETLPGLAARVAETMRAVLARHRGEAVLLVGLDSVNRVFLLLALDVPLARFRHLHQDPCAVSVVTHDHDRGWAVPSMDAASHLQSLR
jgi:broad specificity phosphatase PhoE